MALVRNKTQSHGHDAVALALIEALNRKVQWLSAWTIHNANHVRSNRDGLKVGGHQASSASLATVLSALYFSVLRPQDRIAVKPHASPAFHAIQYLFGNQTLDQLQRFRALGGAQSYPSRTKDQDDVDFSTGSVGLGVAMSAFASLAQDYLHARGKLPADKMGRMISLMGDAELDEGNIYEALIEGTKHDLRNTWWIIDYNRQSLDSVTTDRMFTRFTDIFEATGWRVVTLKYGKLLQAAFAKPGGEDLRAWIDTCANDLYAALTYKGGAAWRAQLTADIGNKNGVAALIADYDDAALHKLMTNLAGHDLDMLLDVFHSIDSDQPHCFIAYTIKGFGLPFQGHKDNHSGLMTPTQMQDYRAAMKVAEGAEWEKFAGLEADPKELQAFLNAVPFVQDRARRHIAARVDVPLAQDFPLPTGNQSTQVAFGKILNDLARSDTPLADAIITTSPDVTVSTNLGGWVNQRGIFSRTARDDTFKAQNVVSPQKWSMSPTGQHLELGIAEHNLFLALAALGLTGSLFGTRTLPIGTLYDPFINRGLDALNYACYQDARFMLVATPSGLTLAPEGGAHQSIHTPLIGMAQDKLAYFEPAYVDELAEIMRWGFTHMQAEDGGSVYLRLSTRTLEQPARVMSEDLRQDILRGAYWQLPPAPGANLAIAYCGAVAPDVLEAQAQLLEDLPGCGVLAVPSPDLLHLDWQHSVRDRAANGIARQSHAERLLSRLAPGAALVTVMDGYPTTLSWLGSVLGHRVMPLGVDHFGQSGDLDDLYRVYRLNAEAILDAAATAFAGR
jgi:pyruvate dehydrogenase E1 component